MAIRPIIAMDASLYAIRMVVIDEDGKHLLDSFEGQPEQTHNLIRFFKKLEKQHEGIALVASPVDRWPEGLEKEIRKAEFYIQWLSPDLMRGVNSALAPWNKKRRLHRASLLAYLARTDPSGNYCAARELTLAWEAYSARETIDEVNSEFLSRPDHGFNE